LTPGRISRLEKLDFVWNVGQEKKEESTKLAGSGSAATASRVSYVDKVWNIMFEKLEQYYREHGDCLVPISYGRDPKLASWVKYQRSRYKKESSSLTPGRISRLEKLDFVWYVGRGNGQEKKIGQYKVSVDGRNHTNRKNVSREAMRVSHIERNWNNMFKELVVYQRENGDTFVPQKYPDNEKLGNWVHSQRRQYSVFRRGKGDMDGSRITELETIGFQWDARVETRNIKHNSRRSVERQRKILDPHAARLQYHVKTVKPLVRNMAKCGQESRQESGMVLKSPIIMEESMSMKGRNEQTMLSYFTIWADGRLKIHKYKVAELKGQTPSKVFKEGNKEFVLACSKIMKTNGGFTFGQSKEAKLFYIATKYPGMKEWNLQKELEKIADFRSLSPGKAVARLEHFNTSFKKDHLWTDLKPSDFEYVREDSHLGCGFIPEEMLCKLLNYGKKKEQASSEWAAAIQVRIFAPSMGIFKGMLVKKSGIDKIQLPSSMKKVRESRRNQEPSVVMIAKQLFPAHSNRYLGRYLSPNLKDPPTSFEASHVKRFSDMYKRLWKGFGVPIEDIKRYVEGAKTRNGLRHASLVGVCDPTGKLPEGHVFVTGEDKCPLTGQPKPFVEGREKLFVSRSPCVEPSDAHILPVVNTKPNNMQRNEWDHLCSYPFGLIIFATPKNKKVIPLPVKVADGDLDGDQYFVCWDSKILETFDDEDVQRKMKASYVIDKSKRSGCLNDKENRVISRQLGSPNWLEEAQNQMLEIPRMEESSRLVGKAYNLCCNNPKIYDEDARAFGRAYKEGLDAKKHGGKVSLPSHLLEQIPKSLRYLCDSERM